tara:strand:+ start:2017 stop:4479 length:2463 start_codon:yes stop_codon:yes gene_type:complete
MARQRVHQASFLRGELDPKILSRVDLAAYGQGLKKARNVVPVNQGGIERRSGSVYRANLGAVTRIETFIFNETQEYVFAFQNQSLKIYSTNGTLIATLSSCPWVTSELFELNFTQSGDTMIIVHENFVPQVITRVGATSFVRQAFGFEVSQNGADTFQPYFKFADDSITLDIDTATAGTGVTVTTSSSYFTSSYVGMKLRYHGSELTITGYISATQVTATLEKDVEIILDEDPFATKQGSGEVTVTHVQHGFSNGASIGISGAGDIFDPDGNGLAQGNLNGTRTITIIDDNHYKFTAGSSDTATESVDGGGVRVVISGHPPTTQWDEQVFSAVNGFPRTVTFHEQRLFFGGVTSLPDGIQASKVADFFNFDVGDAEDADSVQIQIASDQINEIRHLVSSKVLEIFTSTGEFFLKAQVSKPITPTNIQIIRQSSLGIQAKSMPKRFDGATIFIQNNGKTVREFFFNSGSEEFTSNSISLLSSHLISTPVDSATITSVGDRTEQFYFLVNSDGTMGVFTSQRAEKIAGWVLWETDGTYESVACTTGNIYAVVKRTINGSDVYNLEQFSNTSFDIPTDCTTTKTLSGSYQPHGTPLVNGAFTSTTTFIADGFTNAPSQGETFQFGGTGTTFTIQSATATSNAGEFTIVTNTASSQSDNTALQFVTSKVFSGLNTTPNLVGKTVHATSGSTEGGNIFYFGNGLVDSNGNVTFDTPISACDIGLLYSPTVHTLPIDATIQGGQLTGHPRKIGKAVVELSSTYNIQINSNDVILTTVSLNTSSGIESFTGKKEVYVLGYSLEPNLEISQSVPVPMRILGLTTEVYF